MTNDSLESPETNGQETEGISGYEAFEKEALENLDMMSRTKKGISDTSSSESKPKLDTEGDDLALRSENNFKEALRLIWGKRDDSFESPAQLGDFVEEIASCISQGLLKEGQSQWRTWETKFGQTSPQLIKKEMADFYKEFLAQLNNPQTDPIKLAAWVEKRVDGEIHPFADGCGRTSKILSSFVLLRFGQKLPKYRGREEYYKNINSSMDNWVEYYRSLFS